VAISGQNSCETIQVSEGVELKYPKSEKNIFMKTLNNRLCSSYGCRYTKSNTLLVDDSPEKSILNDTGSPGSIL
jgi:hypothetical protein